MEWKNIIGGVALLIFGALMGRSSPVNNQSNAENKVTINQQIPENFEKNSKLLKNIEKNSKKININTASKYDLIELKGIGEKKAQDIINGRPYVHIKELKDKGIIGYYSYENNKEVLTVGD